VNPVTVPDRPGAGAGLYGAPRVAQTLSQRRLRALLVEVQERIEEIVRFVGP